MPKPGRWIFALALSLFGASTAHAAWQKASSDHFVVYADDDADEVQRFAEMLERYHTAMELLTGRALAAPSPSNRVTIYAVGRTRDVAQLAGSSDVAGFYVPRAGGSVAFVPDIRATNGEPDFSMVVLMHEYAHHFLISTSRFAMPMWLSEGSAEFFASARFPKDGSLRIGRPANHRAAELAYIDRMTPEQILRNSPENKQHEGFYGNAWLLYHYLNFDESRKGQLAAYWIAMAGGKPSLEAGREAFGDLRQLGKDVERYSRQRRLATYNIPPEALAIGPISVSPVSAGMAAMLPLIVVSKHGVTEDEAKELAPKVRRVAVRYPNDPAVLAALAEAEYDAGNDNAALDAADQALAIDPATKDALIQKGYALFHIAETAGDGETAFRDAIAPFQALNRLENDHPLPLIYFYRSFVERGVEPTETARHALERAAELAPFDRQLWWNVAVMEAGEGEIALARDSLRPLAVNPHGGEEAQAAARLLAALEDAPEGTSFDAADLIRLQSEPTEAEDPATDAAELAAGNTLVGAEP